jgi:hypothetical protein
VKDARSFHLKYAVSKRVQSVMGEGQSQSSFHKARFSDCVSMLGCHNKGPQIKWLKQQNLISSWFWKLEVKDQGICRVVPSEASLLGFSLCPHIVSVSYFLLIRTTVKWNKWN